MNKSRSREIMLQILMECLQQAETRSNIKPVLLWKGWVLKQRLNDIQSCVGAVATRARVESPLPRTFRGLIFSKISGQLLLDYTRNPRHLDIHPHTRHREMFMRQDCYAPMPQAYLDFSPCATSYFPTRRLLRSHAGSAIGSFSVRK